VASAVESMPRLRHLELEGVDLLTDADLVRIGEARRGALNSLSLRKCVQLSDASIEALARYISLYTYICIYIYTYRVTLVRIGEARHGALNSPSLRKCVQLSDASIEALARYISLFIHIRICIYIYIYI